jgi:ribosomal protein S18 acetylase RimI-like enzyme
MISYKKWDSEFFKLKIGEIVCNSETDFALLHYQLSDFSLVYVFSTEFDKIETLEGWLNPIDTKLIFRKSLDNQNFINSFDIKDKIKILDAKELQTANYSDDLLTLAILSGHKSRFNKDVNFSHSQFIKLYKTWLYNSINHEDKFVAVYLSKSNTIVGFITLELSTYNKSSSIGLIAVNPEFQGNGIARKLISFMEDLSISKEMKSISIATQKSNEQAIRTYTKAGYTLNSETYIYHIWNNK